MTPAVAPGEHGLIRWPTPRRVTGQPASVARLLDVGLTAHPDREALVGRHARYTWHELDVEVARAVSVLSANGVRPGDRVAAALPNQTDIVVAFLATMRAGAIWVGMNDRLAPAELSWLLDDCGATVVITTPAVNDAVAPGCPALTVDPDSGEGTWTDAVAGATALEQSSVDVDVDAPAAIAYTSGTTGRPKGAVHSQHNICVPAAVWRQMESAAPRQRHGVVLNLSILNLMILGPVWAFQHGWTCVAIDRSDPVGLAEWIEHERVTRFTAVPTMMLDLLTHPDVDQAALATIERVEVGGSAVPESYNQLHEARFGERPVTGYGLTEAPTAAVRERVELPRVPGACGHTFPHIALSIRDLAGRELATGEVGEICLGPVTTGDWADIYTPMLGYWNRPEATAEALRDGVLHTGDLGYVDGAGNLFVKDRLTDVVIRGGANVYPAEVERVLMSVPGVQAAAAVGIPDERLGERLVAVVIADPSANLSADDLRAACRDQLAGYKVPSQIRLVEELPRNAMGKVRKPEVRQWFAED